MVSLSNHLQYPVLHRERRINGNDDNQETAVHLFLSDAPANPRRFFCGCRWVGGFLNHWRNIAIKPKLSSTNVPMNYELTIKLGVESPEDSERIERRLRAILEFGTPREVIGDALDLEDYYGIIDVAVTPIGAASTR